MGKIQEITIRKYDDGTIVIKHKHRGCTADDYAPTKSVKGTVNALENLLNGYHPDHFDLHNHKDNKMTLHFGGLRKAPKPLGSDPWI